MFIGDISLIIEVMVSYTREKQKKTKNISDFRITFKVASYESKVNLIFDPKMQQF